MSFISLTIIVLIASVFILILLLRATYRSMRDNRFQRHSLASKYGKMTENFMPFLEDYPYDPHNFRFIGNPVDGVSFEEDRVVFVEFKTASSRLTPKQMQIRELIENRRVTFEEHRLE